MYVRMHRAGACVVIQACSIYTNVHMFLSEGFEFYSNHPGFNIIICTYVCRHTYHMYVPCSSYGL